MTFVSGIATDNIVFNKMTRDKNAVSGMTRDRQLWDDKRQGPQRDERQREELISLWSREAQHIVLGWTERYEYCHWADY